MSLRKAFKPFMFLLTCLIMTGCYTLKTASVSTLPAGIEFLVVHADNNYWTADSYSVSGGNLVAHICTDDVKTGQGNTAHIWVAPDNAITVEGESLTVPTTNIGKVDYHDFNLVETVGYGALWALIIFTLAPMILG